MATRGTSQERELTAPVDLCDGRGLLNPAAVGWSRRPLHRCNLRGHFLRKKRWNYWAFTGPRYVFSATIAHLDYVGVAFVYFLDLETGRYLEQNVVTPLGRGVRLSATPDGDGEFVHPRLGLTMTAEGEGTRVRVDSRRFGGSSLSADLLALRPAGHETLNVVIPWSDDRFQFTSKQNCLPASGHVTIGGERVEFAAGSSFGCLDFGRGVWRYRCFWNWGSCSGRVDGRTLGLNLGGGWTAGTGMTENGICLDGRITKVSEEIVWGYDKRRLMEPWAVRTPDSSRIDVRFQPVFERVARTDLLVVRSEVHQLFGRYTGSVEAEEGQRISFDGLVGWVEQHEARW